MKPEILRVFKAPPPPLHYQNPLVTDLSFHSKPFSNFVPYKVAIWYDFPVTSAKMLCQHVNQQYSVTILEWLGWLRCDVDIVRLAPL